MSPDHVFNIRRLATARRQYMDARHCFTNPLPGELAKASAVYSVAELELLAATLEVIASANLDGTETSPLMGGVHAD